jgi:hypothetical protein
MHPALAAPAAASARKPAAAVHLNVLRTPVAIFIVLS